MFCVWTLATLCCSSSIEGCLTCNLCWSDRTRKQISSHEICIVNRMSLIHWLHETLHIACTVFWVVMFVPWLISIYCVTATMHCWRSKRCRFFFSCTCLHYVCCFKQNWSKFMDGPHRGELCVYNTMLWSHRCCNLVSQRVGWVMGIEMLVLGCIMQFRCYCPVGDDSGMWC